MLKVLAKLTSVARILAPYAQGRYTAFTQLVMKYISCIIIILIFYSCGSAQGIHDQSSTLDTLVVRNNYGRQAEKWLQKLEKPKYAIDELKSGTVTTKYLNYNFSTLLTPHSKFLGYIGPNYDRFRVFFTSVTKSKKDPGIYYVTGISVVKNNKQDFTGNIVIKQVREYKKLHYGVDDIYKSEGIQAEGLLLGEYLFKENSKQNDAGILKGIVTLYWYLDRYGIPHYDDISQYSDSYFNNQYVGRWIDQKTSQNQACNWGEYRIPFSGNLDIGAGYFSPDPKYYSRGWEDFKYLNEIKD